jgi:aspartate/glutamate racemase
LIDTQAFDGMSEGGPIDNQDLEVSIYAGAKRLQAAGASAFVVPCFSAHRIHSQYLDTIPWFNLRHLAMNQFRPSNRQVMMLEAGCTNEKCSFKNEWENHFGEILKLPYDHESQLVNRVISNLMGNRPVGYIIGPLANLFSQDNVEIILGCSELSLADWHPLRVFDALKASAEGLAKFIAHKRNA